MQKCYTKNERVLVTLQKHKKKLQKNRTSPGGKQLQWSQKKMQKKHTNQTLETRRLSYPPSHGLLSTAHSREIHCFSCAPIVSPNERRPIQYAPRPKHCAATTKNALLSSALVQIPDEKTEITHTAANWVSSSLATVDRQKGLRLASCCDRCDQMEMVLNKNVKKQIWQKQSTIKASISNG